MPQYPSAKLISIRVPISTFFINEEIIKNKTEILKKYSPVKKSV